MPRLQKHQLNRCPYCARPLAGDATCDTPTCQTRTKVAAGTRLAAADKARRARAAKVAQTRLAPVLAKASHRIAGDTPVVIAMAPFLLRDTGVTSAERGAAFLAHLDMLLTAAFAPDAPNLADDQRHASASLVPPERPELDAVCIACRGWCCVQGGASHAFLTRDSLLFQRHLRPDATAEELRAAYIDHMPQHSVTGSCVFHGVNGCTLPRDRRSDTCNAWQCAARAGLAADLDKAGTDRVVAAALCREHEKQPQAAAPVLRIVTHDPEDGFRHHTDLSTPALAHGPD